MRIGIDIDDTIADTYETIFVYAYEFTLKKLKRDVVLNMSSVSHHDYTKKIFGWTDEESDIFWDIYFDKIVNNTKPFTLAVETLNKLKEEGNQIIFITARYGKTAKELTEKWLKKYKINYDKLIVDAQEKGEYAKLENIDLFIDDSLTNCKNVSSFGIKSFLMNTRTNNSLETENVLRVYTWPDIYNKIKKEEII